MLLERTPRNDVAEVRTVRSAAVDHRAQLTHVLLRVADDDHAALRWVYDRTSAKLYRICLRILPDGGYAEEALQDAFVRIWRKAASFDPARGSPIAWLAAIARNSALDRLRSRKEIATRPIEAARAIVDERETADIMIERAQDVARLSVCLNMLSAADADLIRAAFLRGTTYAELAARTGLPLGTVKSRVRRALIKLRDILDGNAV